MSSISLSGVDTNDPIGAVAFNDDKSTGITIPTVEAGNLAIYTIGAQQGLGNPPLDINGTNATLVSGFINIMQAETAGAGTIAGAFSQTATGSVSFSHFQTTRDAAASALEINAAPPVELQIETAILLQFQSALGSTYTIEESTDLASWTNSVTNINGDGSLMKFFFEITEPATFYRLQLP